jgi:hypothetical protein
VEKLQRDIQNLEDDIDEHSVALASQRSEAAMEAAAAAEEKEVAARRARFLAQQGTRQALPQQQTPRRAQTFDLDSEGDVRQEETAILAETVEQQLDRLKARAIEEGNEGLSQMIEALSQIALTTPAPQVQGGEPSGPSAPSSRRARQPFGAATGAVQQATEHGVAPMSGVSGQEQRSVRARTVSPRSAENRTEAERLARENATETQAAVFQAVGATAAG